MNDPTKTKYLLFNQQKILSPPAIAILDEFRGYELGRSFNEHGTIIKYSSDDIPGYVFRRMKTLLGDENELLRHIFPNFINTAHYLQNRDANVARSSVPEPGQYMIPSPYVTPYLINATWHPLMSMLPSASSDMDVVPSSDLSPTIDLSSPSHSEDYSNMETTSHIHVIRHIRVINQEVHRSNLGVILALVLHVNFTDRKHLEIRKDKDQQARSRHSQLILVLVLQADLHTIHQEALQIIRMNAEQEVVRHAHLHTIHQEALQIIRMNAEQEVVRHAHLHTIHLEVLQTIHKTYTEQQVQAWPSQVICLEAQGLNERAATVARAQIIDPQGDETEEKMGITDTAHVMTRDDDKLLACMGNR
ncbi:hypothetical protein HA402_003246 [Bradysia odoriphaga]|nr:hypothetical protein HA402_003246 [Bradysia odoriphaga]